jgi:class 3 adenylate cyclase/tetratricopeptide (TPR) repeat protein
MAEMFSCPACGHGNDGDQRFCTNCGTSLLQTCPNCSATNLPGAKFCGNCGNALAGVPTERRLPGERRLATVLFADISGFTNISKTKDPEDLKQIVDSCMTKLAGVVERYDGFVDKVIGDALMAVFGAPIAHGDDPERAVRAALEMQQCAVENEAEFGGLTLSIGINTGDVYFAPAGPDERDTVLGDAVNAAQRLQAAAAAGEIFVGDETRRASDRSIAYESVAPVQIKSTEEPIPAYRAVKLAAVAAEGPAAPIVGRDGELGVLRGVWERVTGERRAHLVTVLGPPGIGKTRLALEVAHLAETTGGVVVRGRSLPYGQTSGYGALSQQVKQVAGVFDSDAPAVAGQKLMTAVSALFGGEAGSDVGRHLAALLGLGEETIPDKHVLFLSVRRFVEAISAERPLLLVFEDIHWADASLLDLIEHLAGRLRDAPLLILALTRPELLQTRPTWGGGLLSYTALPLEPLSAANTRELALRLLREDSVDVDPELVARLGETAEGNPLFIEELAASLAEQRGGSFERLPTTVHGIIAARLDSLPDEERTVVFDASVVGKLFWRGVLERLGSGNGALDAILDSLEGRDLVRREPTSRLEGDEEYSFKHMLIREVAYATLPKAVRRERHAAVATLIEEFVGERIGASASILAHHWEQAGELDKAVDYMISAARVAGRAWAKAEAAALYSQALDLMPADDARRQSLRLERAITLAQAGEFAQALPELDDLIPALEGRDRFEALDSLFKGKFWALTDAEGSRAISMEAGKLAEALGDQELRAVALYKQSAATAMDGAVEEALVLGREALAAWKPGTRRADRAEALEWHSLHHYWLGRYEGGVEVAREAIEVGTKLYNIYGVVNGHGDLGLSLAGLGRHEEALEVFARGAAQGRELELQPRFTSRLLNMWAGTLRELYELNEARRLNEEAIELAGRISFAGGVVSGQIDLAVHGLLSGDIGAAEAALPQLLEAAAATKGWHQWLWTARIRALAAELELTAGRLDQAVEAAQAAVEHAEHYGRLKYVVAARTTLGAALLAQGDAAGAAEVLRRALAEAETLKHPPSIWRASGKLAEALYAVGDDSGAEAASKQARGTLDAFASALSDERRGRFLAMPQVAEFIAVAP